MDTAAAVSLLGDGAAAAAAVGGAVVLLLGTALAWRMVRRAFS